MRLRGVVQIRWSVGYQARLEPSIHSLVPDNVLPSSVP